MAIGERWLRWWERLTHGGPDPVTGETGRGPRVEKRAPAAPASARPLGQVPTGPDGELKLELDPGKGSIQQRKKIRSAGFDPYSNDAGYEKPRNWDEVDPR